MDRPEPPLRLQDRDAAAHKGDFGRVSLIGGSRGMAGSVSLTSLAALRCGSGLVTAIVPDRCLETVASFHPSLMTRPLGDDGSGRFGDDASGMLPSAIASSDAVGCGPGMTTCLGSQRIVERLLHPSRLNRKRPLAVVLDADAINLLTALGWGEAPPRVAVPLVLTPHPGELERLTGASAKDRPAQIDAAARLAATSGAVVVLKGGPTVVVDADRRWTNTTGNPGMATAGTGDVLTGVVASLLGQRLDPWDAARLAVWIHGLAGDRAAERLGMAGMTAVDLLDDLPWAVAQAHTTPGLKG